METQDAVFHSLLSAQWTTFLIEPRCNNSVWDCTRTEERRTRPITLVKPLEIDLEVHLFLHVKSMSDRIYWKSFPCCTMKSSPLLSYVVRNLYRFHYDTRKQWRSYIRKILARQKGICMSASVNARLRLKWVDSCMKRWNEYASCWSKDDKIATARKNRQRLQSKLDIPARIQRIGESNSHLRWSVYEIRLSDFQYTNMPLVFYSIVYLVRSEWCWPNALICFHATSGDQSLS